MRAWKAVVAAVSVWAFTGPVLSEFAQAQTSSSRRPSAEDRRLVRRAVYVSQAAQAAEREVGNVGTARLRHQVEALQAELRTKSDELQRARTAGRAEAGRVRQLDAEIAELRRRLAAAIDAGNAALAQLSETYARELRHVSENAELLLETQAGRRAFELVAEGGETNRSEATDLIHGELLAEDLAAERAARLRRAARYRAVAGFYLTVRGSGRATTREITRLLEEVVANDPSGYLDWIQLSQVHIDAGTLDPALHAAQQALARAGDDPSRSMALSQLGDVWFRRDDSIAAARAYDQALEIDRRVAEAAPSEDQAQRHLAVSLDRVADQLLGRGDRRGALNRYREALAIRERRFSAMPSNFEREAEVAVSHAKIAHALLRDGDHSGARQSIDRALAIERRLAARPDASVSLKRNFAVSLDLSGDLSGVAGDHRTAGALYTQAVDIRRALLAADPGWLELQRVVVLSLTRLGDAKEDGGDHAGAVRDYEQGLQLIAQLSTRTDASPHLQRDRSVLLHRLADIHIARQELDVSRRYVVEGYEVDQRLAQANPVEAEHQRDIAVGLTRLAMLGVEGFTWARAAEHFRGMEAAGQLLPEDRPFYAEVSRLAAEEARR